MENKNPLITIGILNMNGVDFLKKTIPSILKQEYHPLEILVVDNNSTDESIDFLSKYKNIKIIKNKINKGYGGGKNDIVKYAQGKYVFMLDNDIELISKGTTSQLLPFYLSQPKTAFVSIPLLNIGEEKTDHYGLFFSSIKKFKAIKQLQEQSSFQVGGFTGGCVFFKKSVFIELGMYETIYPFNIDDYDMSARAYLAGYDVYTYTDIYANHLGVKGRTDPKAWCWKYQYYFCGFSRMMWKNYTFWNLIIWWPLIIILSFWKALKFSVKNNTHCPMLNYARSWKLFFRDVASTVSKRILIQSKRKQKKDMFLRLKSSL